MASDHVPGCSAEGVSLLKAGGARGDQTSLLLRSQSVRQAFAKRSPSVRKRPSVRERRRMDRARATILVAVMTFGLWRVKGVNGHGDRTCRGHDPRSSRCFLSVVFVSCVKSVNNHGDGTCREREVRGKWRGIWGGKW